MPILNKNVRNLDVCYLREQRMTKLTTNELATDLFLAILCKGFVYFLIQYIILSSQLARLFLLSHVLDLSNWLFYYFCQVLFITAYY